MKDLEGFEELASSFAASARELPRKNLSKAVKKGASVVQRSVRSAAPERSGDLRRGLILHKERSRQEGKVVYDLMPDPKMNDTFQKPIRQPVRSKSSKGYYPASQEYGFFTRSPGGGMIYTRPNGEIGKMDKVPGKYYMRSGAEVSGDAAETAIVGAILDEIEKTFGG